jgi:tetratricopeptide (TPR) repeat protein
MDEPEHRAHEERALALWEAGELEAAAIAYDDALQSCPSPHWARGQYHTGRASVLAALGRHDEAREQLELALANAIETHGEGAQPVGVARFFLGNHCVEQRAFAAALMTVMPAIAAEVGPLALLRTVQARALAGMGRGKEARVAARAAVEAAEPARRERIETQLAELLDAPE